MNRWRSFLRSCLMGLRMEWHSFRGREAFRSMRVVAHANSPDEPLLFISHFYRGGRHGGLGTVIRVPMCEVIDQWEAWKCAKPRESV